MKHRWLLFIFGVLSFGCASDDASTEEELIVQPKQLNISILLDLSDRLVQNIHPSQSDRDLEIVNVIVDLFRENMNAKGAFMAKDKIRVIFSPEPSDPNVGSIAKRLNIDLSQMTSQEKSDVYKSIQNDFQTGLSEIYSSTFKSENWVGSDIWRFFKFDARELCVSGDTSYRNILVILTDGYFFHENSKNRIVNRTSYVSGKYIQSEGFRNNPNWREKFDNEDYGLIFHGEKYEDLEVLLLEINPSPMHVADEDIIRAFIGKWFTEMSVKDFAVFNTALPSSTKSRIETFFKPL